MIPRRRKEQVVINLVSEDEEPLPPTPPLQEARPIKTETPPHAAEPLLAQQKTVPKAPLPDFVIDYSESDNSYEYRHDIETFERPTSKKIPPEPISQAAPLAPPVPRKELEPSVREEVGRQLRRFIAIKISEKRQRVMEVA